VRRELTLDERLRSYGVSVKGVADDYNWEDDVLHALIQRTEIENRWSQLTSAQKDEVRHIDQELVQQHERVAEMLPSSTEHNRRHWWWFLHEGPQVREEAQEAA
jgi:hypothetical protein